MAKLNMKDSYSLDDDTIDKEVAEKSIGNYALGYKNSKNVFIVKYVGRSDTDVNRRLKEWVDDSEHPLFKFSYAKSVKEAYEKECRNYHDFSPSENDMHPAKPKDKDWECPVCEE